MLVAAEAEKIHGGMDVRRVFDDLGVPYGDPCSGLHCAVWRVDDGRRLFVSFSDPCGTLLQVTLSTPSK